MRRRAPKQCEKELTQNANNGRIRAEAIEKAIRDLGGFPDTIGPFLGRAAAAVKALTEQAQPFDEALLGDLALEDQLLDRSRYIKALAVAAKRTDVQELADRLITAHSATVNWLTTVLAEDALGGPAALRRTPLQAAAGTAVKIVNLPGQWSAQSVERVAELVRSAGPAVDDLVRRAQHASDVALKALGASRDAALQSAEAVVRDEGAEQAADALHSARAATGVLDADELPIPDYDELNLNDAVAAVKELEASGRHPDDHRLRGSAQEPAAAGLRRADPRGRHRAGGRRPELITPQHRAPRAHQVAGCLRAAVARHARTDD